MNAVELKKIGELKEKALSIERLIESDGWKMFVNDMLRSKVGSEQLMFDSKTGHDLAKHFGANYALRSALDWPERALRELGVQIEQVYKAAQVKVR